MTHAKHLSPAPGAPSEAVSDGDRRPAQRTATTASEPSQASAGPFDGPIPFRALLEKAAPAYVADAGGRLIFGNPGFEKVAAALYETDSAVRAGTGAPAALRALFERLRWERGEILRRDRVRLEGGPREYFSRHFALRGPDGTPSHFCGVYADIDGQAQIARRIASLQSRLLDFVRAGSDWTWETDAGLVLTALWGRAAETFGLPNEALIGRQFDALGRFAARPMGMSGGADLMAARAPFRRLPFLVDLESGHRRLVLSGVPVFDDESGRFTGYRGTAIDLTARAEETEVADGDHHRASAEALDALARRNQQLDGALEHARIASRAKTEFLATMSHELRTPLTAIIGLAEMSTKEIRGPLPDTYRGYFEDIHLAGKHLLAVIEQMLDATEIDGGRINLDIEPVAVADIVREARAMVAPQARDKNLRVTADETVSDTFVLADPARLRQILVNLLNNAVKFTPDGGCIGIETAAVGEGMLGITVWDNGVGISPRRQALVFESFYKGDADLRLAGSKGVGLGLSISRHLARLMDGDLSLESEPGAGSRFLLRLPVAPDPAVNWPGPRD